MSNTKDYYDLYADDHRADGVDYTLSTTYAVYCLMHRSGMYGYDDYDLISYPTIEEAEQAFAEALASAKDFIADAIARLKRGIGTDSNIMASARVSLCVELDVMMRPADSFSNADLAWSGETSDGSFRFETDMDDFVESMTRDVTVDFECWEDEPSVNLCWRRGEI